MTNFVLAEMTASVSELKKNPMATEVPVKALQLPFSIATNLPSIAYRPAFMRR